MADTRSIDDDNYIQLKELPEATSVKDTDVVLIADGTTDEKKATIAKVKAHIMTSVDNKLNDYSTTEEMNSAIETEIEGASSTIAASLVDDTSSATDKVLSAQGSRGISNGAVCSSSANASAKTVTINGFVLETGAVIRILFTEANSAANPTINITYDGTNYTGAKSIKAVKAGTKIAPPVHSGKWRGATAYTDEMWQPYTTLELMYDGTDWVIMGNPELENWSNDTEGYIVKANGYCEQTIKTNNSANYTVNFPIVLTSNYECYLCGVDCTNYGSWFGYAYGFSIMNKTASSVHVGKYATAGSSGYWLTIPATIAVCGY